MFNFKFIKSNPNTYVIQYRKGKIIRQGLGLSFWCYKPLTQLCLVSTASIEVPFIFKENTVDHQEISVQGLLVFRIVEPLQLAKMMNYSIDLNSDSYISEDPEKLSDRILSILQVYTQNILKSLPIREALLCTEALVGEVTAALTRSEVLAKLGVEVVDLNILAIKPNPETARALEASVREQMLEEADEALYRRRNSSIEQERAIKENELNTELAIESKQQQIKQSKIKAEMELQEQRRAMNQKEIEANIEQEQQRQDLVGLSAENKRKQADVKAYEIAVTMEALSKIKTDVLEAMTIAKLNPDQLVALGIREFASHVEKVGQLNITPDMLSSLAGQLKPSN